MDKKIDIVTQFTRDKVCGCGNRAVEIWRVGDQTRSLCIRCAREIKQQAEHAMAIAPFPHKLVLRRNARNTFSPYDAWEGRHINATGKSHPFVGLSQQPDRLVRLTGREHEVWVADWRARELQIDPYKNMA